MPRLIALILPIFVISWAQQGFACSCGVSPIETNRLGARIETADLVFLGKVEDYPAAKIQIPGSEYSESLAKISVVEGFKGIESGELILVASGTGSCSAPFHIGNTVIVFAKIRESDNLPTTNMCSTFIYHSVHPRLEKHNDTFKERAAPALEILRGDM